MRTRLPLSIFAAALAAVLLAVPAVSTAAGIEKPVRGKKYPLSKQHGPWMIMVASFSAPPPEQRTEGMSPQQAADELVFELRAKGMPAYTYAIEDKVDKLETVDRLGEPDTRIFASQRGNVCVLAGNYLSIDPKSAEKKLRDQGEQAVKSIEWVKSFRPKFLTGGQADRLGMVSLSNGGIYRETPGQKGPLAGAFFTTNPLLTSDDLRDRDPERVDLLTKINAGGDCSLYDNKGKYTIVVASFYGNSVTLGGKSARTQQVSGEASDALYVAAQEAWELATYMRQLKYDAYVWHDEHKSVVTVGSFEDLNDPRIPQTVAFYAAKVKPHAETKAPVLTAEFVTMPFKPTAKDPLRKKWIFDPQPRLMARHGKLWTPLQPGEEAQ